MPEKEKKLLALKNLKQILKDMIQSSFEIPDSEAMREEFLENLFRITKEINELEEEDDTKNQ